VAARILVIEDDRDLRRNMKALLESEGYEVDTAENGQEGLTNLEQAAVLPSIILLDLMMPVMDGFHFRELQLKNEKFARIPVIVLTADGHTDEKRERTHAHAALRKPADVELILDTVAKVIAL
jgi:CheY-like chemotaxis protein